MRLNSPVVRNDRLKPRQRYAQLPKLVLSTIHIAQLSDLGKFSSLHGLAGFSPNLFLGYLHIFCFLLVILTLRIFHAILSNLT
jgi:hypothetical protein